MFSVLHTLYEEATTAASKFNFDPADEAKYQNYARYCKVIKAVSVIAGLIFATLTVAFFGPGMFFIAGLAGLILNDFYRVAENAEFVFENALSFGLRNVFTTNFNKQVHDKMVQNTLFFSCFK